MAFESDSNNLVSTDLNNVADIFVRDRQTGATTLVSLNSSGAQAADGSGAPAISSDGRFVAFESSAGNLVSSDTNNVGDIFVRDRQTAVTRLVSVESGGAQSNDWSQNPAISGDGRFVAFESAASNLVAGDTNSAGDVFVHDLQTGETTRASVDSSSAEANAGSGIASLSADGRFVAFASSATNLVSGDTNGATDVFVRDRQTGLTLRASVSSGGLEGNKASVSPAISADGRFVAFSSAADNLVAVDINSLDQIFIRDLQANETTLVSTESDGRAMVGKSYDPAVSDNGRFVAFQFDDRGDGVALFEILAHDRQTGASARASSAANSSPPNDSSFLPAISGDGLFVAFSSSAANLISGDTNGVADVFVNEISFVPNFNPTVIAVTRADLNPTSAAAVNFNVSFSEAVTGVDVGDFALRITGDISGASVTNVSGTSADYTVTVNIAAGSGTLSLDVVDDDSVVDGTTRPLGGPGAGNGGFSTGESYTIDRSAPIVTGSLRADPNPNTGSSVRFAVIFSEAVSGVDGSDFALTTTGLSGTSVSSVSGSGNTYTIAVATGVGSGTIRLDAIDNDTIVDGLGNPLGGTEAGNGNFSFGEIYTINKTLFSSTLRSNGANDGWVLESNEASGRGGSRNANAFTFNLGDDGQNRQYRAILHFPTAALPDDAVLTLAILVLRRQGQVGADPFLTHQNIQVDLRYGPFGSSPLEPADFEAAASSNPVGTIQNAPVGDWYFAALDSSAFPFINLTGVTQFRLSFQVDDNNDLGADYLRFFSGNYLRLADRPMLYVEYFAP